MVCLLEGVGFQKAFHSFLVLLIALYVVYIKMQQHTCFKISEDLHPVALVTDNDAQKLEHLNFKRTEYMLSS